MIDKLIAFSIKNKLIIWMFVFGLIGWGTYSLKQIPLDAIPDITNNQVLVITQSPNLATQEVEQFITAPIEIAFSNLPDVVEIRSISRFGISVITIVFEDYVDSYLARQQISEQLRLVENEIPKHFGTPEIAPITTGLGEVFQYILHTTPAYDSVYNAMDLREMNDWIVKRQLAGTKGVIEVNGWGGYLKQYEVAVAPAKLKSLGLSISDIYNALSRNNENAGGSYIEKKYSSYFIRTNGLVGSLDDVGNIVIKSINNLPILIKDVATVQFGSATRYGAISWNGKGEVVSGQCLMLKGENSYAVVKAIKAKLATIQSSLPEGVILQPFLDRSGLIDRAIGTVTTNLIEGGLIVVFILVLLLGNFRGGLIVASVIPLSLLFALGMMNLFGVSANLMSLGAIDFGLIVDGAVIIVESIIHRLYKGKSNLILTQEEMDEEVRDSSVKIRTSASFGEIIILIVYFPIFALVGIEGKTFGPMAQTVSFAIMGALILSLTYVPMMCALFLSKNITNKVTFADRIINFLRRIYLPLLNLALKFRLPIVLATIALFFASVFTFNHLGGEFIPSIEEGDFALHQILPPGSSLKQSVSISTKTQKILMKEFPGIEHIVTKIGSAEIPTDPMPMEIGDIMVKMKPKSEWKYKTKEEMFEAMEKALKVIPGVQYEFTQPIQMRFNELISGSRKDIAIKIYGEDLDVLAKKGSQAETIIKQVNGATAVKADQTTGLPQIVIDYDRQKIAQYGLSIQQVNRLVETAFAGGIAGTVFEGVRRFDLVVRLEEKYRNNIDDIKNLLIPINGNDQIPLQEVASISYKKAPMQIARENSRRRITVGVNAKNRDIESLVAEIDEELKAKLDLPPGYYIAYGGQFENLKKGAERLAVAVPIALLLIFVLLFFTFQSVIQSLLIFSAIPMSVIGGIYALYIRDMPFSISAGVGFIALFGVAVLNGIVLIGYFNQLKKEGMDDVNERIVEGTKVRLRPVIMTALVAALGFLPMAFSNGAGGEVQKPLATVVIGGLLSATFLTLFIIPILYSWTESIKKIKIRSKGIALLIGLGLFNAPNLSAQNNVLTLDNAIKTAILNHPSLKVSELEIAHQKQIGKANSALEKTTFEYNRGQLNSDYKKDYQISISQDFKFPSYYSKSKLLNLEQVKTKKIEQELSKNKLTYEVQSIYLELMNINDELILKKELISYYDKFYAIALKKQEVGESTVLVAQTIAVKRYKLVSNFQSLKQLYDRKFNQLQLLIGDDKYNEIEQETFFQLKFESVSVDNSPLLEWQKQQLITNQQAEKVFKAELLPDFSLGYFNQKVEGVSGFQGINIGLKIPLFYWTQKGKINASIISTEIAEEEYKSISQAINSQQLELIETINNLKSNIEYFETKGLPMLEKLLETSQKSFKVGESHYADYLITLKDYNFLKQDYLNNIKQYNKEILKIQLLQGID